MYITIFVLVIWTLLYVFCKCCIYCFLTEVIWILIIIKIQLTGLNSWVIKKLTYIR